MICFIKNEISDIIAVNHLQKMMFVSKVVNAVHSRGLLLFNDFLKKLFECGTCLEEYSENRKQFAMLL